MLRSLKCSRSFPEWNRFRNAEKKSKKDCPKF